MKDENLLKKLDEMLAPLVRRCEKLEEKLEDITKNPAKSGDGESGNLDAIAADIAALKTSSQSIATELANLKSETQTHSASVDNQLAELKTSLQTTGNDLLTFKSTTETNLTEICNTVSTMSSKVVQLETVVSNLTENVIPNIQSQLGNSSGGGSVENWVTLYDKDSTDPEINWDHPNGVFGGETVRTKWNVMGFKKFRFVYSMSDLNRTWVVEDFDFINKSSCRFSLFNPSMITPTIIFSSGMTLTMDDDQKGVFAFSYVYKITMRNKAYPLVEKETQYYYYMKIEGLPY